MYLVSWDDVKVLKNRCLDILVVGVVSEASGHFSLQFECPKGSFTSHLTFSWWTRKSEIIQWFIDCLLR